MPSDFYKQFMGPDSMVFDVGANVGNKTEQFLPLCAHVVAFEPVAQCVKALGERFKDNPKVHVVPMAVGSEEGEMEMDVGDSPNISTLAPGWKRAVTLTKRFGGTAWSKKQRVKVTTLDEQIARFGMPEFVKVDVEGYEDKVILGLSYAVRGVCFEFTPEHMEPMIGSVRRLMTLGEYEFNYVLGETLRLGLDKWVGEHEIIEAVLQVGTDNVVYGDVYARLR